MEIETARSKKFSRIAGALYLGIIIFGLIAEKFVREELVNYDEAMVTSLQIKRDEFLFRFGFVSELLMLVCDVAVTTILFILFRQVSNNLNLFSTFFRLISIAILGITALSHYAAVVILSGDEYLTAFNPGQLNAFALLSIKLHGVGYNISLLFFGIHLLMLGILIYKSRILKITGILLQIAGGCYFANSIIWFLFPHFITTVYPAILLPCFIAELFFALWLIKGFRPQVF